MTEIDKAIEYCRIRISMLANKMDQKQFGQNSLISNLSQQSAFNEVLNFLVADPNRKDLMLEKLVWRRKPNE